MGDRSAYPIVFLVILALRSAAVFGSSIAEEQESSGLEVTSVRLAPTAATWWTIDADPGSGERLIVCAQRTAPSKALDTEGILYGSRDEGETWRVLYEDGSTSSEVSCGLGSDDAVYFVDSRFSPNQSYFADSEVLRDERMHLRWSPDIGTTWHAGPSAFYLDSAAMVVARGKNSLLDRLYLFAHGFNGAYRTITISGDGGRTLEGGMRRLPGLGRATSQPDEIGPPAGALLTDGTLGFVAPDPEKPDSVGQLPRLVTFSRIRPSGDSLGPPAIVGSVDESPPRDTGGWNQPLMAVNQSHDAKRGRIYVTWVNILNNRSRIVLALSDDNGMTWSSPRVVDDSVENASRRTGAQTPALAVTPQGTVGLLWAENVGRCWRFSRSTDDGETFAPSIPLNDCAAPLADYETNLSRYIDQNLGSEKTPDGVRIRLSDGRRFFMPNRLIGLTADRHSIFHAAWAAWGAQDDALYVSRIAIRNAGGRPESTAVLRKNIENALPEADAWLEINQVAYNEATREFVVGMTVVQAQKPSASWPVLMTVRRLISPLGPIHAIASDDAASDLGPAWQFERDSSQTHSSPVGARQATQGSRRLVRSRPRQLHFRLLTAEPRALSPHEKPFELVTTLVPVSGGRGSSSNSH
jgi:hypothetical protein